MWISTILAGRAPAYGRRMFHHVKEYTIETVAYLGSTGRRDLFEQLVEDVSR